MRFCDAVGMKVAELVEFDEPFETISPQSIADNTGKQRKLALLDGDPPTPLSGRWLVSDKGSQPLAGQTGTKYVLMARPDIRNRKELDLVLLSFDDFPTDGFLIDLLMTRDEYSVTLRDAQSAIQTLKEWKRDVEISRRRAERARARRRVEAGGFDRRQAVPPQAVPPPAKDKAEAEVAPQEPDTAARPIPSIGATALFTVDLERRITGVNEAFCTITGLASNDAVGKICDVLCLESCRDNCLLFKPGWNEPIAQSVCQLKTKDGRIVPVLRNAETIRDETGSVTGGMESLVDVSGLIREIEAAAEPAKSSALDGRAGEIGSSVIDIMEMTDLMLKGELAPEQRENLELVKDSAGSLHGILDEVLDFSGIEAGCTSAKVTTSGESAPAAPPASENRSENQRTSCPSPQVSNNGETSRTGNDESSSRPALAEERLRSFSKLAPPGRLVPAAGDDDAAVRTKEPEAVREPEPEKEPEQVMDPEQVNEAQAEKTPESAKEKIKAPAPAPEIVIKGEAFDRKTALSHFNDDMELLIDVAGVFLEEFPRKLAEAREAIAMEDGRKLMTTAETIKSTAGAVGGCRVVAATQHLRIMGHHSDLTHAERVCDVLEKEIGAFQIALEEAFTEEEEPQKA